MKRIQLVSALAGVASAVLLGTALPAAADGPLTLTDTCSQTARDTVSGVVTCYYNWSGGTGTITPTFAGGNSNTTVQDVASYPSGASVDFQCMSGTVWSTVATVTDAVGDSQSLQNHGVCVRSTR